MGLYIEPPQEGEMWWVIQKKNGIPVDHYFGRTMDEALSKACNDMKYLDEEKQLENERTKEHQEE